MVKDQPGRVDPGIGIAIRHRVAVLFHGTPQVGQPTFGIFQHQAVIIHCLRDIRRSGLGI